VAAGTVIRHPKDSTSADAFEQIARLQAAIRLIRSIDEPAARIKPDGLPALLIVLITEGYTVLIHGPDDGVVFIREILEAIRKGLIGQVFSFRLVGEQFLDGCVGFGFQQLTMLRLHASKKGFSTALAVEQFELASQRQSRLLQPTASSTE